jgi:hypothetical protein
MRFQIAAGKVTVETAAGLYLDTCDHLAADTGATHHALPDGMVSIAKDAPLRRARMAREKAVKE